MRAFVRSAAAVALLLSLLIAAAQAQNNASSLCVRVVDSHVQRLSLPQASTNSFLGNFVAASADGNAIAAAAFGYHGYEGAAAVFTRPSGASLNFELQKVLQASDAAGGDNLGWELALSGSAGHRRVVAGAVFKKTAAGAGGGAAYVFDNGVQTAELLPADGAAKDSFGYSTRTLGDSHIFIGMEESLRQEPEQSGKVYVFEQRGGKWTNTQVLHGVRGGDQFGDDLAADDNAPTYLVVGAPYASSAGDGGSDTTGAAFVFQLVGGSWTQSALLTPAKVQDGGNFATACAVGAGAANGHGRPLTVACGADRAPSIAGSVTVFELAKAGGASFRRTQLLQPPAGSTTGNARFGGRLEIDHALMVVGAGGSGGSRGSAFVFTHCGGAAGAWTQSMQLTPPASASSAASFGSGIGLAGNVLAIGAPRDAANGNGAVYVYRVARDTVKLTGVKGHMRAGSTLQVDYTYDTVDPSARRLHMSVVAMTGGGKQQQRMHKELAVPEESGGSRSEQLTLADDVFKDGVKNVSMRVSVVDSTAQFFLQARDSADMDVES